MTNQLQLLFIIVWGVGNSNKFASFSKIVAIEYIDSTLYCIYKPGALRGDVVTLCGVKTQPSGGFAH